MVEITFNQPGSPVPAVPVNGKWVGEWASQSPLNQWHHATEGGGAEGNPSYCALVGDDSNEFYIESTPNWWTPTAYFDLRDTQTTFYLKAVKPITVAPGYSLHVFIVNDYKVSRGPDGAYLPGTVGGFYLKQPVVIGDGEWALNRIDLTTDESQWLRYTGDMSLSDTLARAGFIGVMYFNASHKFTGVHATGVLGVDCFRFDMPREGR